MYKKIPKQRRNNPPNYMCNSSTTQCDICNRSFVEMKSPTYNIRGLNTCSDCTTKNLKKEFKSWIILNKNHIEKVEDGQ